MASIFKKTMACLLLRCMILILTVSAQTPAPGPVGNNMTSDEPTSAPSMPNITETMSPTRVPTKAPVDDQYDRPFYIEKSECCTYTQCHSIDTHRRHEHRSTGSMRKVSV